MIFPITDKYNLESCCIFVLTVLKSHVPCSHVKQQLLCQVADLSATSLHFLILFSLRSTEANVLSLFDLTLLGAEDISQICINALTSMAAIILHS